MRIMNHPEKFGDKEIKPNEMVFENHPDYYVITNMRAMARFLTKSDFSEVALQAYMKKGLEDGTVIHYEHKDKYDSAD